MIGKTFSMSTPETLMVSSGPVGKYSLKLGLKSIIACHDGRVHEKSFWYYPAFES